MPRKPAKTIRQQAKEAGLSTTTMWRRLKAAKAKVAEPAKPAKPVAGGTMARPEAAISVAEGRRFILTSAQNNTMVHPGFLASLKAMAAATGARLLVSRYTYNKDAWDNGAKVTTDSDGVWYDDALDGLLVRGSVRLAADLLFCAELDRLPTSGDPLAGLDSYTRESSGVVGHPKVAMKSLPVLKGRPPRFMFSSGTVTQRNYVDRLAGQKAAFHHVYGALYIEVDEDGSWFARQLNADDESGEFQDLGTIYSPTGPRAAPVEAVVWGDIHRRHLEPEMREACWGPGGILDLLRPRVQVLHDVLHFSGRSHHDIKDPFLLAEHHRSGSERVEDEIRGDAEFLRYAARDWAASILPSANHHHHLRRWLAEADFRRDPVNARYGHYLAYRTHEAIERGDGGGFDVYEFAAREAGAPEGTRFLRTDESYVVEDIELGIHGDLGPNGSRGSPKGFRALGRRTVTGHTHTAGITDGVYTVGVTGSLDQGYNKGPSSWSHTHCLIYSTGKRALLTMRGTRWRGKPLAKPRPRVRAVTSAAP